MKNNNESIFMIGAMLVILFSLLLLNNIVASADFKEDLYVLSHVINGEAQGYSNELKFGVGSVVLNRVNDDRFPNTIPEVVFQPGQYACTWDGNYDRPVEDSSAIVALILLIFGSRYPPDIIWQGNVPQGSYIYKNFERTYFCG